MLMETSRLKPYLKSSLDILFVGLNPATGSSRNGHYFSVNSAFWNQLYESGLIIRKVHKISADDVVFGTTEVNCNGWSYGITDLVPTLAESDSRKVKPGPKHCASLIEDIVVFQPKVVILLHSQVRRALSQYLSLPEPLDGKLGRWSSEHINTEFFAIPFPHGNAISSSYKIALYEEVRLFLLRTRANNTL